MSIIASEIIWKKSATNDDTSSNGGRMVNTTINDGVKNNIIPDVSQSERTNGVTRYRKAHIHIANDDDIALQEARIFIETSTLGDDSITIFEGTFTDTQSGISGSEQQYGGGPLNADVSASATTMDVLTEDVNLDVFVNGMLVRISDKTDVDDAGGKEEYVTLNAAVTYTGHVAHLTFTPALANSYLASATRVSSVIEAGTIEATATAAVVTSGAGTFDDAQNIMDSIGTIEQDWTLTFDGAGGFTIVGDTVGSVGSGTEAGGATPTNNDYAKPYFVINAAAFGGTYANLDTVTFTTHPATIPLWYKQIVPLGASSLSGNKVIVAVDGESA